MKKKLLWTMACLLGLSSWSQAQITVTVADFGVVGDSLIQATDTTLPLALTPGPAGANQTWDFTSIGIDVLDTFKFLDPAAQPNGFQFPNSTVALDQGDAISFLVVDANGVRLDGFDGDFLGVGAATPVQINPDLPIFEFPANYLDAYSASIVLDSTADDVFTGIFDSLWIRRYTEVDAEIDAWGSVTTPSGTYNTLRQKRTEANRDTVWGLVPILGWQQVAVNIDTQTVYSWVANGEDYPVLEVTITGTNGPVTDVTYIIGTDVQGSVAGTTQPACVGDCDGTGTVAAVSGTGMYTYLWPAGAGSQTTATATGLCAGTYTVTITDGITTATVDVTITDPPALVVAINTGGVVIESIDSLDGEIPLSVNGGNAPFTYNWTGPNGFTSTDKDLTGLEGGEYNVTVTDANGCTETATHTLGSAVTVEEWAAQSGLTVYPNPANNQLTLEVEGVRFTAVSIYGVRGELIRQESLNGSRAVLQLDELSRGSYILRIESDRGVAHRRVSVMR